MACRTGKLAAGLGAMQTCTSVRSSRPRIQLAWQPRRSTFVPVSSHHYHLHNQPHRRYNWDCWSSPYVSAAPRSEVGQIVLFRMQFWGCLTITRAVIHISLAHLCVWHASSNSRSLLRAMKVVEERACVCQLLHNADVRWRQAGAK